MNTRRTNIINILLCGGISTISLLIVLFIEGFFPFGHGSILAIDLQSQYAPLLYRFYDILHGYKNVAIDFHIGGGINLYTDTMTTILNPFNYILLLFDRSNLYLGINLLIVIYGAMASMTSCFALTKLFPDCSRTFIIVLSLTYGLSYYMAYQYEIINWLYIVVLFPLFFLSLNRLLYHNKPYAYIIFLAYILCNSFQLGTQLCMFTLVYATCVIFFSLRNNKAHTCLILGLSTISSVSLSAPVTYPTIKNLLQSARSDYNSSIALVITHHGLDNILERLFEISSPITLGIIIFCFILLKDKLKRFIMKNKPLTVCLSILFLTVLIEPANLLWHLGSYQCFPVRYGYVILWLTILFAGKLLNECKDIPLKKSVICKFSILLAIISILGVLLTVYKKRLYFAQAFATLDISNVCFKQTLFLYALMAIIVAAVILLLINYFSSVLHRDSSLLLIMLCATVGITWNLCILLPSSSPARLQMQQAYEELGRNTFIDRTEIYTGHAKDNPMHPLNASLIDGSYSMTAYVPSGESKQYVEAMSSLGYETPWISVYSTGGSELSDLLLGIGGEFDKALNVSAEKYENLCDISDYKDLLVDANLVSITFDNRLGRVILHSDEPMSGYVLLPMAYIDGWHCDSGLVTSHLNGFLAVKLSSLVNDITLSYRLPGLTIAILIAVVGLILAIVLLPIISKEASIFDKPAKLILNITSLSTVLMVYLVPLIGMLAFFICKSFGYDFSDYLVKKNTTASTPVLLSQTMTDDGLYVLIAKNNLLLQKNVKVTASDEEGTKFRPSKVCDGDSSIDSRWSSSNDYDNNEHFLLVDFGESYDISAIKIYWERTNACNYSIESSVDGDEWITMRHFDEPALSEIQTEYFDQSFKCRFLRVHVFDVTKNEDDLSLYYQNVSICELEAYSTDCDRIFIPTPSLSKGYDRQIPLPDVPKGYRLAIGGIDYDNLLLEGDILANTISPIDINMGYTLTYRDEFSSSSFISPAISWDLDGFDVTLPASDGSSLDTFPYENISYKEWKSTKGTFIPEDGLLNAISSDKQHSCISRMIDADIYDYLGDEGFEITIDTNQITLASATNKGMIWAKEALLNMLRQNCTSMPCGILRDYPKYAVRGFVIDVGRRPISIDTLYQILDKMAQMRMNTLQLHLNDNALISSSDFDGTVQGARELYSGYRIESSIDGLTSTDLCYETKDLRQFITTAKAMGIDVVPEIDTPAHSLALTKLFPEMGYDDDPRLADTLNVSKPGVFDLVSSLWDEQLCSKNGAFVDCDVLHLGMDEYYGDDDSYSKYIADLTKAVHHMAPDKKLRMWGSMTFKNVNPVRISKDIDIMIWNTTWDDPYTVYSNGFGIINCLSNDLYIIVDNANEQLDIDYLAKKWQPNVFVDGRLYEEIPSWSPRMLGACYSMWNDFYCNNMTGPSDEHLIELFEEPLDVISDKLW